jgi:hypothetical protein
MLQGLTGFVEAMQIIDPDGPSAKTAVTVLMDFTHDLARQLDVPLPAVEEEPTRKAKKKVTRTATTTDNDQVIEQDVSDGEALPVQATTRRGRVSFLTETVEIAEEARQLPLTTPKLSFQMDEPIQDIEGWAQMFYNHLSLKRLDLERRTIKKQTHVIVAPSKAQAITNTVLGWMGVTGLKNVNSLREQWEISQGEKVMTNKLLHVDTATVLGREAQSLLECYGRFRKAKTQRGEFMQEFRRNCTRVDLYQAFQELVAKIDPSCPRTYDADLATEVAEIGWRAGKGRGVKSVVIDMLQHYLTDEEWEVSRNELAYDISQSAVVAHAVDQFTTGFLALLSPGSVSK